jgi:LysM repeat protein
MILGIHVVVIGGLLLQGCDKNTPKDTSSATPSPATVADQPGPANNPAPAPAPIDTSLAAPASQTANTAPANPGAAAIPAPATQLAPTLPATPANPAISSSPAAPAAAPAMSGGREYVIAQGDTLGAIARKNGISVRALQEANSGINPRKLQIGQKLQIPAGGTGAGASAAAPIAAAAATDAAGADAILYTVKPGDMLLKIAKAHGTRVKTIMELNDLKTTSIRVGQKLKLPSKVAAAELPAPVSPATQTASTPPAITPAPTAAAN